MKFHINEMFWTIQGEGANAGRRAFFVRLPYCNLACSWCDTDFKDYNEVSMDDFKDFADSEKCRFAVVTGGEPTMHKHFGPIVLLLKHLGFEVAIETNGCFPIDPELDIDFVTVSPKRDSEKFKDCPPYFIHPVVEKVANEFKYVVDKEFDLSILERHDPSDGRRYSVSPEYERVGENMAKVISWVEFDPRWRVSLQTHKYMGVQ